MNCQGGSGDSHKTGHGKHGSWLMWCCLIPMVLVAGALFFGYRSGFAGLLLLLCPLLHVGMMVWMARGSRQQEHPGASEARDN